MDGRLRRYYRITDEGTQELAAEVGRLRANTAVAASRLGLAPGQHERLGEEEASGTAAMG